MESEGAYIQKWCSARAIIQMQVSFLMTYKFAILDPRSIPAASAANDAIFASGVVVGVEVTVPALAARCAVSIDPQHAGQDTSVAAIEAALVVELPQDGATLATVRADLDSIGAMAILAIRAEGVDITPEIQSRIRQVADADKFVTTGRWCEQSLPTTENPWSGGENSAASERRELAAIAAEIADFKVGVGDRVTAMRRWLTTGEESSVYRAQVERERGEMLAALSSGQISHQVVAGTNGKVAVVQSAHRAATSIGYRLAPVVVALNPEFRVVGGQQIGRAHV